MIDRFFTGHLESNDSHHAVDDASVADQSTPIADHGPSVRCLPTDNWLWWPVAMIPFAVIGFLLSLRVWNAKPTSKSAPKTESSNEAKAAA